MSTGKTVISHASQAISLEQLRQQQAEQAERVRQRLGVAHAEINRLDVAYRELVARRDHAARRLPDLQIQEPAWPELEAQGEGIEQLEHHAAALRRLVAGFEQDLTGAIREAEAEQARRLALASAWRNATALEQAVQVEHQNLVGALKELREDVPSLVPPIRPDGDALLSAVELYTQQLRSSLVALSDQKTRAVRRQCSQHQARTLAGTAVDAVPGAQARLEEHAARLRQQARESLESCLAQALKSANLDPTELPHGTQALLSVVLDAREATPLERERIHRLVAREHVLQQHAEQARTLMMAAPDLVYAQPSRGRRWQTLLQSLQAVCSGLEPFSPVHQQEYDQIKRDAQRDLDRTFVQAEFAQALREQDLLALSSESGTLVIEDLRNLGVRMEEAHQLEFTKGERGGMATVLELKTDSPLPPAREAAVVDDVCQRLQAAARSTPTVKTTCVELEHKKSMVRSRRPAGLKRFRATP